MVQTDTSLAAYYLCLMFCWDTCLALPTTTLWAHGCIISMKEPLSKKPLCQEPFGALYTERSKKVN